MRSNCRRSLAEAGASWRIEKRFVKFDQAAWARPMFPTKIANSTPMLAAKTGPNFLEFKRCAPLPEFAAGLPAAISEPGPSVP